MDDHRHQSEAVPARLSLWDAVSIIIGIIIGAGIFEAPSGIFLKVPGPWAAIGLWVLGGLLALVGALCFAELASAYPHSGGEYIYLTRAYGSLVGYLFAWAQFSIIRPGSIAAVAYVFANYADRLASFPPYMPLIFAMLSIIGLTAINILGVTLGTRTQNFLTIAKLAGLGLIVVVGLIYANPQPAGRPVEYAFDWLAAGMIAVLFTYSGWHEAGYVAAEVRNPSRNLPLALLLGTTAVTLIYVTVNVTYLICFGFEGAQGGELAAEVFALAWGTWGQSAMCLLVVISTLGGINGMIFTTARIYTALGSDHRLFHPLGKWSRRWGTPVRALIAQAIITLAMIVGLWIFFRAERQFDVILETTTAVFFVFFLLTGISVFVLRWKDPNVPRPFSIPGFPVVPILFCAMCGYMVVGAIDYAPGKSLIGLLILLAGLPFYLLPKKIRRPSDKEAATTQNHTLPVA